MENKLLQNAVVIVLLGGIAYMGYSFLNQKPKVYWMNKTAYNLYRYIKFAVALGLIAGLIAFCCVGVLGGVSGMLVIVIETLVKNGLILLYLRKKVMLEYSEDYLVPQWFKDQFYRYLNNKAELRVILLFLYMPLFYVIPLPFGTFAIVFYIMPVCILSGLYLGYKWIKAGKHTPIN